MIAASGTWRQYNVLTSQVHFDIITAAMKSKAVARSSRRSASTRAKRGGGRKATTFRLDPRLEKGLALLGEVRRVLSPPFAKLLAHCGVARLDAGVGFDQWTDGCSIGHVLVLVRSF